MKGPRPEQLVVVVGTGTDVGKTWVSAALLSASRDAGMTVAARKPVQSFEPGNDPTDADVLGSASGEDPEVVCLPHRWYEVPFAPPMAADSLGRGFISFADLCDELVWPDPSVTLGLVEMAGGIASPVSHDGDQSDFVAMLKPDRVVLVAEAGLGAINAVLLSLRSLAWIVGNEDERRIVTVLNRYDANSELHRRNRDWLLRERVTVLPSAAGDAAGTGQALVRRMWTSHLKGE